MNRDVPTTLLFAHWREYQGLRAIAEAAPTRANREARDRAEQVLADRLDAAKVCLQVVIDGVPMSVCHTGHRVRLRRSVAEG